MTRLTRSFTWIPEDIVFPRQDTKVVWYKKTENMQPKIYVCSELQSEATIQGTAAT